MELVREVLRKFNVSRDVDLVSSIDFKRIDNGVNTVIAGTLHVGTPILVWCIHNSLNFAAYWLVSSGNVDVNHCTSLGCHTALFVAVPRGSLEFLQLLLDKTEKKYKVN